MSVNKNARKRAVNGAPTPHYYVRKVGKYKYTGYEAKVTIGYDENGRQIQKRVSGKTQKQCQKAIDDLKREIEDGYLTIKNFKERNVTVEQWMNYWLKECCVECKDRTLVDYERMVKNHIVPGIGKKKLKELDSKTIQCFVNRLTNKTNGQPLAAKTKRNVKALLYAALSQARAAEIIKTNYASKEYIRMPKVKQSKFEAIEIDYMSGLLEYLKNRNSPYTRILIVILMLGLREGEGIGLSWDKVNWKKKEIKIDRQVQVNRRTGEKEYRTTKEDDTRILSMPDTVVKLLKEEKAEQDAKKKEVAATGIQWGNDWNLIFTKSDGRPIPASTLYNNFKRAAKAVGIPDSKVHDLRHQCATASLEEGVDIDTVSAKLGHANSSFTLDVYPEPTKEAMRQSAAAMDRYIARIL